MTTKPLTEDELLEIERLTDLYDLAAPRLLAEVRRLRKQAREDEEALRQIASGCDCIRKTADCVTDLTNEASLRLAARAKEGK